MTFDKIYIDWNYRRVKKIIDYFGHQAFHGKTVLDLGCGHSDIGGALGRLGATVTALDARQEHLTVAKKKYPYLTTICYDLENDWIFNNQKFDFVLAIGISCHIKDYKRFIENCCKISKYLILESEISDSNDPNYIVQVNENKLVYDWSFNGIAYKPSAPNIENILNNCKVKFTRLDSSDLNTSVFKYDWKVTETKIRKITNRRFWIIESSTSSAVANLALNPGDIKLNLLPDKMDKYKNVLPIVQPQIVREIVATKQSKNKIAICISGYLRTFEQTALLLKKSIPNFEEADIFIHTWDKLGAPLRGFDRHDARVPTQQLIHRINKLYNPIKMIIEPAMQFHITPLMVKLNTEKRDINGILSMFYKIEQCNKLKSKHEANNDFKYECVIRVRSDLNIYSQFNISNMNNDKLYLPHGHDYEGLNDQIAYGSSHIMDKYSKIFSQIEMMVVEGEKFNPERFVKNHVDRQGIQIERFNLRYDLRRAL